MRHFIANKNNPLTLLMALAALFFGPQCPVFADQVHEQAIEAMQNGNYAVAFCLWWPKANQGHAEAQYSIGWMFHNGYGLRINDEVAHQWWEKAASQGNSDAMYSLSQLYFNGDGTEKDDDKALQWLVKAARLNHDEARADLMQDVEEGSTAALKALSDLAQEAHWQANLKHVKIKVARANIRAEANAEAKLIDTLDQGTELIALKQSANWWQILLPEKSQLAWIYAPLVESPEAPQSQP